MSEEPKEARPALPVELRAATREKHHALNLAILEKLPLCLPPAASSPFAYVTGMVVFGHVYDAFESHLLAYLKTSNADDRLQAIYQRIYSPRLLRTARLRRDLETLTLRLGPDAQRELDRLAVTSTNFRERVLARLSTKPHTLLAYTWTMYLALFNGGRWIHSQLTGAGSSFWLGPEPPLSFWEFVDEEGRTTKGEDVKVAFKDGFSEADRLLSDEERDDIINESNFLFDLCSEMVSHLDDHHSRLLGVEAISCPRAAGQAWGYGSTRPMALATPAWHSVSTAVTSIVIAATSVWRRKELSSD